MRNRTDTTPTRRDEPRLGIAADVRETPEGWRIDLAVPGVRPEDVDVRLERDGLEVVARRAPFPEPAAGDDDRAPALRRLRGRIPSGTLVRRFLVPDGIAPDGVDATLEHGVLRVGLRRTRPERRTIEVRST